MSWLKKIFTNTSSDALSSQQLGDYLFEMCARQTLSFLDSLDKFPQKILKVSKEDINQTEVIIAFMWLFYDLLQQDDKYHKALTQMHSRFMNHMAKYDLSTEDTRDILLMRYDEYRECHRHKGTIDFTYKLVGAKICKNILDLNTPNTNLYLEGAVIIALQESILNIGKHIKSISIKDT